MDERLLVEHGPDIYAVCSRPECGTAAGCSCSRYRTPTPADLVAHVVALPADEARALLVALLRARPEEAVGAVLECNSMLRAASRRHP